MARCTVGDPIVICTCWLLLLLLLQTVDYAQGQTLDPGDALVLQNLSDIWPTKLQNLSCDGVQVECQGGRVTKLDLSFLDLVGVIPPSIQNLTALTSLNMSGNKLIGRIPRFLGGLSLLSSLILSGNNHTRKIPAALGKLSSLKELYLDGNMLVGRIPPSLGRLAQLLELQLSSNQLNGTIPRNIGNLRMLQQMDLSRNQIVGEIPPSLGNLTALTSMQLSFNSLNGTIPPSLGNLKLLRTLDLSFNGNLSGGIPPSLGNLTVLTSIDLGGNQLTGAIPASLGNLQELDTLSLSNNRLSGSIPSSLGNLASLTTMDLQGNALVGGLPSSLGRLTQLNSLYLSFNRLNGSLPATIGDLEALQDLNLKGNDLSGPIPSSLGSLTYLSSLDLSNNKLSGSIPSSLGDLSQLTTLDLSQNRLTGAIPSTLGKLEQLDSMLLSGNGLNGSIPPTLGSLEALTTMDLSDNNLSGPIPSSIGDMSSLNDLKLSNNMLTGSIPSSIGDLGESLSSINFTNNRLSGSIPQSFSKLNAIINMSLANNQLTGAIPALTLNNTSNLFQRLDVTGNYLESIPAATLTVVGSSSLKGNCMYNSTPPLPEQRSVIDCVAWYSKTGLPYTFLSPPTPVPAPTPPSASPPPKRSSNGFQYWWIIVIIVGVLVAAIAIVGFFCCLAPAKNKTSEDESNKNMDPKLVNMYSLKELNDGTNGWSSRNLLGKGGSGTVYRATLDDKQVAVKRLLVRKGATEASKKAFLNEVAILSKLRHKNLVSLIGYCCESGERILVMDLLDNDSLSKHLFSYKDHDMPPLDWLTRCKIALGTAEALLYLHALNEQQTTIIHRDVKSDNIMLDKDFNPYVCDFGIARLTKQAPDNYDNRTAHRPGTRGYMAPEWVLQGVLSDKLDVYSFGMVLVELVSGKPSSKYLDTQVEGETEEEEPLLPVEAATLVFTTRPDLLRRLVDPVVYDTASNTELLLLLNIALLCLLSHPEQRPSMRIVVSLLKGELDVPALPNHPKAWPWQGSPEGLSTSLSRTQSEQTTGGGALTSTEIIGR